MRPYLRVANVFEARIDTSDVMSMNFTPEEFERYRLVLGDVLLNEGQSPELLGRPALYEGVPEDVAFTNSLIRFQAGAAVLPQWALIVFRHHMLSGRFRQECRVTTNIAHLSATRFKSVEFPVPPLAEQQRIVEKMETLLSQLAAADRLAEGLRKRVTMLREDVLRRAAAGSLVPQDSSETPAASAVIASLGAEALLDEDALPGLPSSWARVALGTIADVVGGVTKDSKRQDDASLVEVPYLRVANVQRGVLKLDEIARIKVPPAKLEALRLHRGDVLMNEGGDRDKLGRGWIWDGQIEDCVHQNHVFRARIRDGLLLPKLLSWHGNTFGQRYFASVGKQTTNLASISLTNLRRLPVPVPPAEEQARIVAEVDRQLSILDAVSAGLEQVRLLSAAFRRTVIRQAYLGALVAPDPADEPAELTLKRIEAEAADEPAAARPRPGTVRANRTDRAKTSRGTA